MAGKLGRDPRWRTVEDQPMPPSPATGAGGAAEPSLSVFISYHREDNQTFGLVDPLKQHVPLRFKAVTGRTLPTFVDTDQPGGVEWERNARHAADICPFCLLLLSAAYLASENCLKEVTWFLDADRSAARPLTIVPISLIPVDLLKKHCPPEARRTLDRLMALQMF
ncbi:MAG: TIR domain-containing protein, partial [Bifidobacteriaceae bacterium]|nr:TIR domain-containing protein [Bifidobacteriaceae bacterium]